MYQPVTLPKLPRPACPYQVLYAENKEDGCHMKSKPCNAPAGASGWCCQHEYVQEILELACQLDYPDFVAAYLNKRPCITITRGTGNWELYATHHMRFNHASLKERLEAALEIWQRSVKRQELQAS